jgi:hypothetical protein
LVMGCSRVGIGGGVSGLDDSLGVSSNIGLKLCAEFGEYWEERFHVPSTIDWRIFNTFLDACLLVVLSCARTWLDCRATLFVPCSFDVLVFNSTFRMKFKKWELLIIVLIHNFPNLTRYKLCHIVPIPTIEHEMVVVWCGNKTQVHRIHNATKVFVFLRCFCGLRSSYQFKFTFLCVKIKTFHTYDKHWRFS